MIWTFENRDDVASADAFLDLQQQVSAGGELGMLGLAFHPDYGENAYFYVQYTTETDGGGQRSRISRFERSPDEATRADPASEEILLEVPQPASTHNAGDLAFGPDGMLYATLGDGGQDPQMSQDLTNLLGTVIRLDVDEVAGTRSYGIPADNPFAGNDHGYREEIYAYGLRNPWRFSFDDETGTLWVADVGDDDYEEINHVTSGANYGWPIMEGPECDQADECEQSSYTLPIYYYETGGAGRSITGGYVYRGTDVPSLQGAYIFGDFVFGSIWKLNESDGENYAAEKLSLDEFPSVVAFGEDAEQELYVLDYNSGSIYRFIEDTPDPTEPVAALPEEVELQLAGPNPFRDQTHLTFTVPLNTHLDVAVYDVLGRRVTTLFTGDAYGGQTQRLTFDARALPAGLYFCRLQTDAMAKTRVLVLTQ